ncbi:MAG: hypothetical protein R3Y24_03150 [Eubacteriales bacterium]
MTFLKYQKDKEKIRGLLKKDKNLMHLDPHTAMVINIVTKLNLEIKEEGEDMNMCQAIDEMMEDSRLLGVDQGIEQGIEVLVNVMKELNVSADFIRENTSLLRK